MATHISIKTTLKVNGVLAIFLVLGGLGLFLYQKYHAQQLIVLEAQALEEEKLRYGTLLASLGSRAIGSIIEEAIDNTSYTVADFFNTEYQEIPGFAPPKYHSKVDSYLDKAILALQDEFLVESDITYAIAVDVNGYVSTHNTRYQQPPTGDADKDRDGNRTKRIFNDPIGIKATKNIEKTLRQIYTKDTGEVVWDISAPIMVKGKHWGAFRIGLSLESLNRAKDQFQKRAEANRQQFFLVLVLVMAAILVVSLLGVLITIKMALKPLQTLTDAANDLADGKIETPIAKKGDDELGQLADVLERLRLSLKKSLDRLRKK